MSRANSPAGGRYSDDELDGARGLLGLKDGVVSGTGLPLLPSPRTTPPGAPVRRNEVAEVMEVLKKIQEITDALTLIVARIVSSGTMEEVSGTPDEVTTEPMVVNVTTESTSEILRVAKSDNARVIILEEQLRDTEMEYNERLHDEQRRSRELLNRVEGEKQLQLENKSISLQTVETGATNVKEEVTTQRVRTEKLEVEHKELMVVKKEATSSKEKNRRLNQEHETQVQIIEGLSREIKRLRSEARTPELPTTSPKTMMLEEFHEEMTTIRTKNSQLQEAKGEFAN